MIGVQGAIDHRRDHAFGVVRQERLFEDAFAGARFAEHQAQTALLGVDAQDVEDFLLVGQPRPHPRSRQSVTRQNLGQNKRKRFPQPPRCPRLEQNTRWPRTDWPPA
ncbi:MAG: hypothetical protein KIS67_28825 [Verrucomicrobiae bacterium]|nr:hypothetical protein [Verrucomicrobiae bacterium]